MTDEAKAACGCFVFTVLACLVVLMLFGCGYAKHKDPKTFYESSDVAVEMAAKLHAINIGGVYERNECCGSMEPLIKAGDWLVRKPEAFTDGLLGKVVAYRRANGQRLLHRLVSGNAQGGFIASGDNNKLSEPDERVTEANYLWTCIAVYKVAK